MFRPSVLFDKLAIFFCCLLAYFFQADFAVNVATVLAAVISGGLLSYLEDERLLVAPALTFMLLAFFFPSLAIFLPVILFDLVFCRFRLVSFAALVPWLRFASLASGQTLALCLVLLILGGLIRVRAENWQDMQAKYFQLSDEAREMLLKLQQQKKDLLEKQDDELRLAALKERGRIAREIHDNVGHLLSSAILQVGAMLTINRDEKSRRHLETLHATLSEAMDSTRKSVHELYDESIDLNLHLESLVKKFTFCLLYYEYGFVSNPPQGIKYAIVAIVKEALANIIKHSNATRAEVILREHPALYQLIIRDNGRVKSYNPDNGMGLKNMAERVRALGGIINIFTADGFEIFISIPKEGIQLESTGS